MILILKQSITSLQWEEPMWWDCWDYKKRSCKCKFESCSHKLLTPEKLFVRAKENINRVAMYYVTEEDIIHKRTYNLSLVTVECKLYLVHTAITVLFQMEILLVTSDTINDVHKFNDSKLLRNPTTYQPGKWLACYYNKIWYIGVILNCSNKNQDLKVKFMNQKGLNLQWKMMYDLVSVGYHLQKFYVRSVSF